MVEAIPGADVMERLDPLDAAFYYGETAAHPLHIGAILTFDAATLAHASGQFRYDDVCALVAGRIHRVPRLRQRVVAVPFGAGRPVWADDAAFDVRRHMRRAALPSPGSWPQLQDFVAELMSRPLERDRPLWEVWWVEGLAGGRVAAVPKIHHSLGDGVSLVDLALLLLDPTREVVGGIPPALDWTPAPTPSGAQRVARAVGDAALDASAAVRGAVDKLLTPSSSLADGAAFVRTLRSALHFTSPMGITGKVGPHRQVRTTTVPLEVLSSVRRAHRVTLNDVVLCSVIEGLRALVGTPALPKRPPRAIVPVSMRGDSEQPGGLLGNRVSLVLPELPVHVADPVERLAVVNAEMAARKAESEARHAGAVLGVARYMPPAGLRAVALGLMRAQPFASILVTNVPGPQFPLYLDGSRMLELYPYLGTLGGMGIVVAVASYDGHLGVTVTADPDLTGDVTAFVEGIEKGIDALHASV